MLFIVFIPLVMPYLQCRLQSSLLSANLSSSGTVSKRYPEGLSRSKIT